MADADTRFAPLFQIAAQCFHGQQVWGLTVVVGAVGKQELEDTAADRLQLLEGRHRLGSADDLAGETIAIDQCA